MIRSILADDGLRAYFAMEPEAAIPELLTTLRRDYVLLCVLNEQGADHWFTAKARALTTRPPVTNADLMREIKALRADVAALKEPTSEIIAARNRAAL